MFLVARTPRKAVGTGDVPRGSDSTLSSRACLTKLGDIKERLERLESPLPVLTWGVSPISRIRLALQWKLPSGVRFAEVSFRNYLANWVVAYMA